jgi:hypothetical protein
MNFKIFKALLVSALVCSAIIATVVTTITPRQTYTTTSSQAISTSEGKPPGIILVGDPLPGGGWPMGGNQTGNQTG